MKYKPNGFQMWDCWGINTGKTVHFFHLNAFQNGSSEPPHEIHKMGHISTDDLLHFKEHSRILMADANKNPYDFQQKWTASAINKDGVYYCFYTLRDQNGEQRIGLATTTDFENFNELSSPVLEPDKRFFINYKTKKPWDGIVDCRDFYVMEYPEENGYLGYFIASAEVGGIAPQGVVGVAFSSDLINWEQRGIVYVPDFCGVVEVVEVYKIDDVWYLTVLSGGNYGGRGVFNEDFVSTGTIYAISSSPYGPFVCGKDRVLMAGRINSCGYSVRTIEKDGKRYALYVTKENGLDKLSLPKRVDTKNGKLRLLYDGLLENLRAKTLCVNCSAEITCQPKTSFAWETRGGFWQKILNGYQIKTEKNSWQSALLDITADNLEVFARLDIANCRAAGLSLFSEWGTHAIIAEPGKNRIILTPHIAFEIYECRHFDFTAKTFVTMRIILADDSLDVYIDDELVINAYYKNCGSNKIGLFADDGETVISELKCYELE